MNHEFIKYMIADAICDYQDLQLSRLVSFPYDTNQTLKWLRSSPEGDISFTFALQRNQSHQCEEITFEQKKLTLILILPKKVAPVVELSLENRRIKLCCHQIDNHQIIVTDIYTFIWIGVGMAGEMVGLGSMIGVALMVPINMHKNLHIILIHNFKLKWKQVF